jgi:hypothetical protein
MDGWAIELDKADPDQQTILFYYPKVVDYGGLYGSGGYGSKSDAESYIKPVIKLEFGARGEIEPHEEKNITPYVAEQFPQFFTKPSCSVRVLSAERTFWEKATILHALHHGTKMRDRMSRHYYDLYMLAKKGVAKAALQNPALLERVVMNKSIMFSDNKASYETAVIGSLRLSPKAETLQELKRDYAAMEEMFTHAPPAWEEMMNTISAVEQEINSCGA